jgi:hypothetical protein
MKKAALLFVVFFTYAFSQPTINGVGSDGDYISVASWTQLNTGFGDHGIKELKGYSDGTNLYLMVVGEIESNFNELYLFINVSDASDGLAAGTQLPAGNDGSSPFNSFTPTLDFQVDYGIRLTSGSDPSSAYTSIINYRGGGNTDTYIGGPTNDGSVQNVSSGTYNGVAFAYKHMGLLSSVTNEGFEIKIPLSVIGGSGSSTFELFALYGANSFISANTIPEISGQSGTNLGNNPGFNSIGGNQHSTAAPLPVELTSFTAVGKGRGVELAWRTATELNNYGFEIERSVVGQTFLFDHSNGQAGMLVPQWEKIGFIEGHGTTNAPKSYTFVDGNASGTLLYRLKQIDRDGKFEYSNQVEVTVAAPVEFALMQNHPNPFNPSTSIRYQVAAPGHVSLKVYDMLGKEVATLVNGMQDAGAKIAKLDASQLPSGISAKGGYASGVYFYTLRTNNFTATKKMLLLK